MPIIRNSSKGKPKLEIEPEVMLRGRNDLIRITIGDSDEIYMYVTEDVEKEVIGEQTYSNPKGMRSNEFSI